MVVDRFFSWVADATTEQKLRAVPALVAAYFDARLAIDDREALEAALTLVADDPERVVRCRLAELLAAEDDAPRHILLTLLHDHPEVASRVAARSEALIEAELVDLVALCAPEIHTAVASRRRVGPTVAAALAEAADREACVALLANPGADLPAIAMERMVDRFGEFADLRQALLARPQVPITVRHRVLEKLSEAIETLVVMKSWMREERAGVVTRDAKDKATVALACGAGTAETVVLVEHLRRTGQLTTRLMLRAACVGNLRFVEEALARLADVPSARVAALVADGRDGALRALYRRSAMPERAYPAFQAAIEVHRELVAETGGLDGRPGDQARFSRRLVERVLTRFSAFERRDSDDLLVLLRRFAADAARDRVRTVMAERMADAARALAPPTRAPSLGDAVPPPEPAFDAVDAQALDAVAAELERAIGAALARPSARDAMAELAAEAALAAPRNGPTADPSDDGDFVESDDDFGLFGHLRLEDLPPEWRIGEVAAEDLFGDDDVPFRRALIPGLRLVVDEARVDASDPLVTAPAPAAVFATPLDTLLRPAVTVSRPVVAPEPIAEVAVDPVDVAEPVAAVVVAAVEPTILAPAPIEAPLPGEEPGDFLAALQDALETALGTELRSEQRAPFGLRGAA